MHVVPDLEVGGAQRLLVTWAREARRRGDVVVVAVLSADRGPLWSELEALGVELVAVPRTSSGLRSLGTQVRALRRVLLAHRPTVVQTHLTRAHLVGLPAARRAGVPTVATVHSMLVGADGNSERALWAETLVLRHLADVVLACGTVVEQHHRDRLRPKQAVVVPNATEAVPAPTPSERAAVRRSLTDSDEALLVLAVGRLADGKGYGDLLTAFSQAARVHAGAELVVVGDGPLAASLQAQADALGLTSRVHLLGQRDDVPALMTASDLYVSASHWEGLPLAMLEAMSAGLPVLATSVGDVPSVVDEGSGVLVPPADPSALSRALVALLSDRSRLRDLGAAARARVGEVAGVARWYDQVSDVHRLAVQRHRRRRRHDVPSQVSS
jgi:glycosyltransferase involved in cell wall biosynthesis